ncbi:MAG: phosphoserine phosphatase SerB [Candidatus Altiarchaeia archaeon]
MKNSLTVVTVLGKDRPGLVADLTGEISGVKGNIVDIEQSVIRGLFSMFMLVDLSSSTVSYDVFSKRLTALSKKLSVDITLSAYGKYDGDRLPKKRDLENVTIMGKDNLGIVADISSALSETGTNIERIKMIARGDLLVMEMTVDRKKKTDQRELREKLRSVGERIGVDIVVQPESAARMRKRLVVFDMDSTIVDAEIIDELAKAGGVGKQVSDITARGMEGKLDFEQSLRERVRMLKGLPVETLDEIRDNMKLTPGSEELLRTLKGMGFKLALISGGFTYFTDELKNKLGFDYAYANELVIKDGKVTGKVTGQIIDSKRKADIVQEIMKKEGLTKEEVVAVGDGANDRIMIKNAGLGIAFNAKEVLKKVADGSITKNNLKGLVYCLGVEDTHSDEEK